MPRGLSAMKEMTTEASRQVADRVGGVGDQLRRAALGAVEDRRDDERHAQRGDGEHADQPVEPHARGQPADAASAGAARARRRRRGRRPASPRRPGTGTAGWGRGRARCSSTRCPAPHRASATVRAIHAGRPGAPLQQRSAHSAVAAAMTTCWPHWLTIVSTVSEPAPIPSAVWARLAARASSITEATAAVAPSARGPTSLVSGRSSVIEGRRRCTTSVIGGGRLFYEPGRRPVPPGRIAT